MIMESKPTLSGSYVCDCSGLCKTLIIAWNPGHILTIKSSYRSLSCRNTNIIWYMAFGHGIEDGSNISLIRMVCKIKHHQVRIFCFKKKIKVHLSCYKSVWSVELKKFLETIRTINCWLGTSSCYGILNILPSLLTR